MASAAAVAPFLTGVFRSRRSAALTGSVADADRRQRRGPGEPNIMLLMDTSGSMAWTHMPDEVEKVGTIDYTGSIGYRSTQCNPIYYNPSQSTTSCRKYPDGTFFPQPSLRRRSLRRVRFLLHGGRMRPICRSYPQQRRSGRSLTPDARARVPVPADPAQPAYYYVYSGAQTLTYSSPACRQTDTGATDCRSRRRHVDARSGQRDIRPGRRALTRRANFATWYSVLPDPAQPHQDRRQPGLQPADRQASASASSRSSRRTTRRDAAINPQPSTSRSRTSTRRSAPPGTASLFSASARRLSRPRKVWPRRSATLRRQAGRHQQRDDRRPGPVSCQQNFTIMTTGRGTGTPRPKRPAVVP